jgi:hypothetical protein
MPDADLLNGKQECELLQSDVWCYCEPAMQLRYSDWRNNKRVLLRGRRLGRQSLGSSTRWWEGNSEIGFREGEYEAMNWIDLAQDVIQYLFVTILMNLCVS